MINIWNSQINSKITFPFISVRFDSYLQDKIIHNGTIPIKYPLFMTAALQRLKVHSARWTLSIEKTSIKMKWNTDIYRVDTRYEKFLNRKLTSIKLLESSISYKQSSLLTNFYWTARIHFIFPPISVYLKLTRNMCSNKK